MFLVVVSLKPNFSIVWIVVEIGSWYLGLHLIVSVGYDILLLAVCYDSPVHLRVLIG